MPNHTSLSHRHSVRSNLNSTMQSSLHDKKSVKRDQISIFTKIPSHTCTYSLCSSSKTNVSEHILFYSYCGEERRRGKDVCLGMQRVFSVTCICSIVQFCSLHFAVLHFHGWSWSFADLPCMHSLCC